jgi:hypothetical protein
MNKLLKFTVVATLSLFLFGCGGSSGGGGDDDPTPLDTTVEYDIAKVLFGTPGVTRTLTGSGDASDGSQWTITQVVTTLTTPDPTDPCLPGETQQDDALTLTSDTGLVITSAGPECWTTSGLLQNTFSLDVTDTPELYSIMTAAGTMPLTAKIGAGGLAGTWNDFEDTDGDDFYNGGGGDVFTGSSTSNWKLEDQQGKAALVLSFVIWDEFGTQVGSETDTFFITPSGTITGFTFTVTLPGIITLNFTGTVN